MPTPFDTWTADDALAKVDAPADYAVLTAYYAGDHYQGGAQWAGPRPQPDQPGYQEAVAGQVVEQSANAITGIVLSFSIVPAIMIGVSLWALSRYPLRRGDIDGAPAASAAPAGAAEETR